MNHGPRKAELEPLLSRRLLPAQQSGHEQCLQSDFVDGLLRRDEKNRVDDGYHCGDDSCLS